VPDDSVLAASVRQASFGAASTAYFSIASAPQSLHPERAASADADSRMQRVVPSPGRESTASSAQQHSGVKAAAVGENAAGNGGPLAEPLPRRQTRTMKRAGQQVKRMDAVRVEVEEASTASLAGPQQGSHPPAVHPPAMQWWEKPQPLKPSRQNLDASELILGGLTAAKTRGAINLTANATVGESRRMPGSKASYTRACSCRLCHPGLRPASFLSRQYPVGWHESSAYAAVPSVSRTPHP